MEKTKKKISFDLDRISIDILKEVSEALNIKQADLLRFSVKNFLENFLGIIVIFETKDNDIFQKKISVYSIEKIENIEVPKFLYDMGFESKGTIFLRNNEKINFLATYKLNENSLQKILHNIKIIKEKDMYQRF